MFDNIELRWGRLVYWITIVLLAIYITLVFVPSSDPDAMSSLMVVLGAIFVISLSTRTVTSRRLVEMIKDASLQKMFMLRLVGFIVVFVGSMFLLNSGTATVLEKMLAFLVAGFVFFNYVIQIPKRD